MPRAPKPLSTDLDPAEHSLELLELAETRHPLNVQIPEYDWRRAPELAIARGDESVSDVVRRALRRELDDAPEAERIRREAETGLRLEIERRQRLQQYENQPHPQATDTGSAEPEQPSQRNSAD